MIRRRRKVGAIKDAMASKLGQRVRELRTALKWSQAELAAASDVEQTAVSRIEVRPGYEPGAFTLYRICRALNTSMDELLAESVEFTPKPPQDAGMGAQLQRMVGELGRNQSELASVLQAVRSEVAELRKSQEGASRKKRQSGPPKAG